MFGCWQTSQMTNIMKRLITQLLLVLLWPNLSYSQSAKFDWAKSMGGTTYDYGESTTIDVSGNLYTTGSFELVCDFDPGPGTFNLTSNGTAECDVFIQKLDANGNFLWAKAFGGTDKDIGFSITTDLNGNVYTTGYFRSTTDFDPGPGTFFLTATTNDDIFIQKLDANGNFLWAKAMGGTQTDIGYSIITDSSGNVYTTGNFDVYADFDPGTGTFGIVTNGLNDIFIQKLDSNGSFIWAKSIGGTGYDRDPSMTIDASGDIILTGYFNSTVDFDPGVGTFNLTPTSDYDAFVLKLDTNGSFVWVKSFGGTGYDRSESITTDASGNIYITGGFTYIADFDPGTGVFNLTSNWSFNIFILKLDANGNFIWAKSIGGTENDVGSSITIDTSGNIYTTGWYRTSTDFNPGVGTFNLTSNGNSDIFILKLDTNGNFIWAKAFGGIADDFSKSIITDISGHIYTTGSFGGIVDFDPGVDTFNLTSSFYDAFIHKMNPCTPSYKTDIVTECDNYIWIDGNIYTANNTTATYTLTNAVGCDSVITLNLTITPYPNNNTNQSGAQLIANQQGATYQWLDCNNNNAIISGETNQFYNFTTNGSYAVVVTFNNCTDTSNCKTVNVIGIKEDNRSSKLFIHPNPTREKLLITFEEFTTGVLSIKNYLGQIIKQEEFNSTKQLDISLDGPSGIYFLQLEVDGQVITKKIVKE